MEGVFWKVLEDVETDLPQVFFQHWIVVCCILGSGKEMLVIKIS